MNEQLHKVTWPEYLHCHFTFLFIYLPTGCAGSSQLRGLSLVAVSGGCSPVAILRLLIAVSFLVAEHGLWGAQASSAVACRLSSCSSQTREHRLNSYSAQAE